MFCQDFESWEFKGFAGESRKLPTHTNCIDESPANFANHTPHFVKPAKPAKLAELIKIVVL